VPVYEPTGQAPSVLQRAAFAISAATSPFVVTAVGAALIVVILHPTADQLLLWGAIGVVFAALLPFALIYAMWRAGRVTDMHVALREQRGLPFAVTLASAAVGVALLYEVHAPRQLVALGVVYLVFGIALALISRRWKISVHSGVLTASILAVAVLGYPEVLWALVIVPPVVWARIQRDKHSLAQGLLPILLAGVTTPLVYYAALAVLPVR
jgi:hypothetical protein